MNINFYVVVPAVVLSHLIAFGIGLVNNLKYTYEGHILKLIHVSNETRLQSSALLHLNLQLLIFFSR